MLLRFMLLNCLKYISRCVHNLHTLWSITWVPMRAVDVGSIMLSGRLAMMSKLMSKLPVQLFTDWLSTSPRLLQPDRLRYLLVGPETMSKQRPKGSL